jgi:hypothetical protein
VHSDVFPKNHPAALIEQILGPILARRRVPMCSKQPLDHEREKYNKADESCEAPDYEHMLNQEPQVWYLHYCRSLLPTGHNARAIVNFDRS